MRFSPAKRLDYLDCKTAATNEQFFARVAEEVPTAERRCGLLLLGGSDFRSLAVRRAQSGIRFDQRVSYWSHAALMLEWTGDAAKARGLEVSYRPESGSEQVPERNGVTWFTLSKYLDTAEWPNVAFVSLGQASSASSASKGKGRAVSKLRDAIEARAIEPNLDRQRYSFLDWLGVWARYATSAERVPNPLFEGVPEPSAAFCEYAFEGAGLDLTPGATGPNGCPELLWSTSLYWYERISELGPVHVFAVIRDESGRPAGPALSPSLR